MSEIVVEMETGVYWKCKVCDHQHDLLTPDGNEEWAMHCGKTMTMQPFFRLHGLVPHE